MLFGPAGVQLDVGALRVKDSDAVSLEPDHPLAKVEPVGVERGTRVAGQVAGDRAMRELAAGIEFDSDETAGRRGVERAGECGVDHREAPVDVKGHPHEHHTSVVSR